MKSLAHLVALAAAMLAGAPAAGSESAAVQALPRTAGSHAGLAPCEFESALGKRIVDAAINVALGIKPRLTLTSMGGLGGGWTSVRLGGEDVYVVSSYFSSLRPRIEHATLDAALAARVEHAYGAAVQNTVGSLDPYVLDAELYVFDVTGQGCGSTIGGGTFSRQLVDLNWRLSQYARSRTPDDRERSRLAIATLLDAIESTARDVDRAVADLSPAARVPVAQAVRQMSAICDGAGSGAIECFDGIERTGRLAVSSAEPRATLLIAATAVSKYARWASAPDNGQRLRMLALLSSIRSRGLQTMETELAYGDLSVDDGERLKAYEHAVTLGPDDGGARLRLESAYLDAHRFDDARRETLAARKLVGGMTPAQTAAHETMLDRHLVDIDRVQQAVEKARQSPK